MTVTVDTNKTGIGGGVFTTTWANRPSSAPATALYFFSDVGESGTVCQYTASRWRPVNGLASLKNLAAATGNITNSETNVIQTLLPVNLLQAGDRLRLWLTGTKSGTTDALHLTVRIGTAGTTADTALTGLTAFAALGASATAGGGIIDVMVISATSAQRLGSNTTTVGTYTAFANAAGEAAATAITDASANALYVSVNLKSSGATNTVVATSAQLQWITP